ncbi:MAG: hypothetical protein K6E13_07825 [Lachnospiraceae bacterium]|nr:hypothetical protein [Lachnospiraceae bacterium]
MVNEDKIKAMTKLAVYDQRESRKCAPMVEYFRSDYIGKELLKSFVMGTIAYMLLTAVWLLNNADELIANLYRLDFMELGLDILQKYVGFCVVYMIITYIVYAVRYSRGRDKVKGYHKNIHGILKSYRDEE